MKKKVPRGHGASLSCVPRGTFIFYALAIRYFSQSYLDFLIIIEQEFGGISGIREFGGIWGQTEVTPILQFWLCDKGNRLLRRICDWLWATTSFAGREQAKGSLFQLCDKGGRSQRATRVGKLAQRSHFVRRLSIGEITNPGVDCPSLLPGALELPASGRA